MATRQVEITHGVIHVQRTALTGMEMNGSEGLVIWNNKYIRVTLGKS